MALMLRPFFGSYTGFVKNDPRATTTIQSITIKRNVIAWFEPILGFPGG